MTTTFVAPPTTGKFQRILNPTGTTSVSDLILDGNRANRTNPPWDGAYNLEQSACLFLRDGTFTVERVVVQNSPGDGIGIYTDAAVTVTDLTSTDCFRGAITMTGGGSSLVATNVQAPGDLLQLEIDAPGDGGTLVTTLDLSDSHLARIELESHGTVTLDTVTVDAGFWLACPRDGSGAAVRITDCTLALVASPFARHIYWPTDIVFTRCDFTGAGLELYPDTLGDEVQGSVSFVDCTFVGSGAAAVYNYGNSTAPGSSVSFSGCTYSGFSAGYVLRGGYHDQLTGSLDPA